MRKGGWSERANPNRPTPGRRGGDVLLDRLGGLESGAKEAEEARGVGGEAEGRGDTSMNRINHAQALTPGWWHPASGHPSGKWRVYRQLARGRGAEEARGPSGRRRLFGSYASALMEAERLNREKESAG